MSCKVAQIPIIGKICCYYTTETRPKKKERFRINKSPTSNLEAILNLEKKKNKLKGRIPSLCSPIISLRNVFDKPSDEFDRGCMFVYYNFYFYI